MNLVFNMTILVGTQHPNQSLNHRDIRTVIGYVYEEVSVIELEQLSKKIRFYRFLKKCIIFTM